jgi:hypothetical protein
LVRRTLIGQHAGDASIGQDLRLWQVLALAVANDLLLLLIEADTLGALALR